MNTYNQLGEYVKVPETRIKSSFFNVFIKKNFSMFYLAFFYGWPSLSEGKGAVCPLAPRQGTYPLTHYRGAAPDPALRGHSPCGKGAAVFGTAPPCRECMGLRRRQGLPYGVSLRLPLDACRGFRLVADRSACQLSLFCVVYPVTIRAVPGGQAGSDGNPMGRWVGPASVARYYLYFFSM